MPTTPDASTARIIALGMTRCGSLGLLGQVAGGLEADDGVRAEQRGQHERAEPGVVAGCWASIPVEVRLDQWPRPRTAATMISRTVSPTIPISLGRHGGVVDPGGDPGRPDDQRGLHREHHERLQRGAGRRVRLADQRLERDLDEPVVHRHRDDRQERERHPAQPPADVARSRAGRPTGRSSRTAAPARLARRRPGRPAPGRRSRSARSRSTAARRWSARTRRW